MSCRSAEDLWQNIVKAPRNTEAFRGRQRSYEGFNAADNRGISQGLV